MFMTKELRKEIMTFFYIILFNSLFTVDFSIVIVTNLYRLTENFIIKRKI